MATLFGAIAYKASLNQAQAVAWEQVREFNNGERATEVECPTCGEIYSLIEESTATDEILEQDKHFLAKGLESVHPDHPACVVVRDPQGALWKMMSASGCVRPTWSRDPEEEEQAA